jgi:3-deoxy-manno-octulosonate cytidylyltransferase (CMP-KDO synthetase)
MTRIIAIIPARLKSSRFPRKVLHPIFGLPMLEHVRRRVLFSKAFDDVFIATCDDEIHRLVSMYGGKTINTSSNHVSGTSRASEAVHTLECTHVVIIQADEPLIDPLHLNAFRLSIDNAPDIHNWNAVAPLKSLSTLSDPSTVKAVLTIDDYILNCFRLNPFTSHPDLLSSVYKLVGLLAFQKSSLQYLSQLSTTPLALSQSIEQLLLLENNLSIKAFHQPDETPSVNIIDDLNHVFHCLDKSHHQAHLLRLVLDDGLRQI